MKDRPKPSILVGIVFIMMGLLSAGIGVTGIGYSLEENNDKKPFLSDKTTQAIIWTKEEASLVMMGVGFLGAVGLVGFGVFRMMPIKEAEAAQIVDASLTEDDTDEEAESES